MATIQTRLNLANPNDLPDRLRQVLIGDVLDGLRSRVVARAGLTNQATHVHSTPGAIEHVMDSAGTTPLAVVSGAPGAGEVQVAYDANGLATLTFAAAVTGYQVFQQVLPDSHGDTLAETV